MDATCETFFFFISQCIHVCEWIEADVKPTEALCSFLQMPHNNIISLLNAFKMCNSPQTISYDITTSVLTDYNFVVVHSQQLMSLPFVELSSCHRIN